MILIGSAKPVGKEREIGVEEEEEEEEEGSSSG
jgi:hypothetical protein